MANVRIIPSRIDPLTKRPNGSFRKRRVAAYARVSTELEEQNNSYEAQVDYYTKLITAKAEWELVGIYTDKGISGTNTKRREGFNRMIEDARGGKIDLIITKSVSRFARNTLDTISLTRELKSIGVEIFFEEQNVYTFDSNGELMLTILASMAQEESRNISENVRWGKNKKARDGYAQVGYRTFLGYDKHPTDRLIGFKVNEEEAETVRFIYSEFLKGTGYRAICDKLMEAGIKSPSGKDRWRVSTIQSILRNEKYKGDVEMQKSYTKDFLSHEHVRNNGEKEKIYIDDHHEAIVSKAEWQLAQEEFKRREGMGNGFNNAFCCKVVCSECGCFYGRKVWHSTDKYKKVVYRCDHKYERKGNRCKTPALSEETIKSKFVAAYNEFAMDRGKIMEDSRLMIRTLDDTKELEGKVSELTAKAQDIVVLVANLIERNSKEEMDQDGFQRKYDAYDNEHQELLKEIERLSEEIETRHAKAKAMEGFMELVEGKKEAIDEYDDELFKLLIEKATVNLDGSIVFLFKNGREIKA